MYLFFDVVQLLNPKRLRKVAPRNGEGTFSQRNHQDMTLYSLLFLITNKIMTQTFLESIHFNKNDSHVPNLDAVTFDLLTIEPEKHQLNQNYFTKEQLMQQPGYQVVRNKEYIYFGNMENNLRHGLGVIITKNSLYEGNFSLNHKMGKGHAIFPNGSVYFGDFANDKPHGHGLLTFGE